MATKRLATTAGRTIEIRAKIRRQGILMHLDGSHAEAQFPPQRMPPPGSTLQLHERVMIRGGEPADSAFTDIEIHFTVQQQIEGNRVRAAVARIARGSLADLQRAYDGGLRPALGYAPGDLTSVKALIIPPASGASDDARFIQEIICTHNDRVLLSAQWGRGMAADPYLAFEFSGGSKGDVVRLSWSDNQGGGDVAETTIK